MPVLAFEASQLILAAVLAAVGALAFWLVGHTVQENVEAVGEIVGTKLPKLLNPGVLLVTLAAIWLIVRRK